MNFFKTFFNRRNTYLTLVLVVLLVTLGGLWQYKNYVDEKNAELQYEDEMLGFEEDVDKEEAVAPGPGDVGIEVVQEETNTDKTGTAKEVTSIVQPKPAGTKKTNETVVPAIKMEEQKPNMQTMISPVFGTVSMDYSDEKLLYSKTLELWTTHSGLDIKADEGTSIRAALDGVVSEITDDPQWGLSMTISHGNGIVTKYSNLSTLEMVKVGQEIMKGDVISGVGKSALCEISDDPHVHFEVLKNGKNLDPKSYLPKQSLKQ